MPFQEPKLYPLLGYQNIPVPSGILGNRLIPYQLKNYSFNDREKKNFFRLKLAILTNKNTIPTAENALFIKQKLTVLTTGKEVF